MKPFPVVETNCCDSSKGKKDNKATSCCADEAGHKPSSSPCCGSNPQQTDKGAQSPCCPGGEGSLIPLFQSDSCGDSEVCCGGPPPPKSSPFDRAGYSLCHYVKGFTQLGEDFIPVVQTKLSLKDLWQTLLTRVGVIRNNYTVSPGLYGVGHPDKDSPVFVSANYKLSFDALRKELSAIDGWILVLDTHGINVWCAAGKKTFSTEEIVRQVHLTNLGDKVSHRELIVPQLGATGVAAHKVKKECGFKVVYGPVRAEDIPRYLKEGKKADEAMRQVTFTLKERFELVPVEFYLLKSLWWVVLLLVVLSGIGPWFYSLDQLWSRGIPMLSGLLAGVVGGAMLAPVLLPWLPGRAFAVKGFLSGALAGVLVLLFTGGHISWLERGSILALCMAISSYMSMNFTGSSPYTSPTGVEKEMKQYIPVQALAGLLGLIGWFIGPFF